jgi:hypothetical protein
MNAIGLKPRDGIGNFLRLFAQAVGVAKPFGNFGRGKREIASRLTLHFGVIAFPFWPGDEVNSLLSRGPDAPDHRTIIVSQGSLRSGLQWGKWLHWLATTDLAQDWAVKDARAGRGSGCAANRFYHGRNGG